MSQPSGNEMNNKFSPNFDLIVEPIPLRDQVADILRRMILSGKVKGDEQISERLISQLLKVSTTPVKEAFRALEAEGLLYVKPRRGSYVSSLSTDFMLQLVFMRGVLEGVAGFFAAMHATDEEILQMETVLAEAGKLSGTVKHADRISMLNSHFHSLLRNACRNKYLISLIAGMRSIDKTFREVSLSAEDDEPARANREHLGILEAVRERNSEKTERLIVGHVRRVALFVVESQRAAAPEVPAAAGAPLTRFGSSADKSFP